MIRRTLREIAAMLDATVDDVYADVEIQGVSTDSRRIANNQLYVPLIGERFDGHAFMGEALQAGAAAGIWQADVPNPPEGPLLVVDDTLSALQKLAQAYCAQVQPKIVGITGSNGKTTTKDMVAATLATVFRVHKTDGNLNNHIGLPLTLLSMPQDSEIAVLEMGMSARGEIEFLSQLAKPDAVIITMIGDAHMLQLGSREEIARAKTEILSGLREGGLFIYNGDEPLIPQVLPEMKRPAAYRAITFGISVANDYSATDVRMGEDATSFQACGKLASESTYTIPLLGLHNVTNALAAIALAQAFGVSEGDIADGLASMRMTGMRIEKVKAESGLTILNDAYNASPSSMKAALALLDTLTGYERKFVVLGDMLELGESEVDYHRQIGASLDPGVIEAVYAYGNLGRFYAEAAASNFPEGRVHAFADKDDLTRQLAASVTPNDVVLVKGSRGMRLEDVVKQLQEK